MKGLYDITLDQKVIGKAYVEERGMYYLINCEIDSVTTLPPTVYLIDPKATVKLGGCYPVENCFRLKTRLSKKILQAPSCRFVAQISSEGTILDLSKPIDFVEALDFAKIKKEGTYKKIYYE